MAFNRLSVNSKKETQDSQPSTSKRMDSKKKKKDEKKGSKSSNFKAKGRSMTNFAVTTRSKTSSNKNTNSNNKDKPIKCCFCEGDHLSKNCKKDKPSVSECYDLVIKARLCLCCLEPNHVRRDCSKNCEVKGCTKKHHFFLHQE